MVYECSKFKVPEFLLELEWVREFDRSIDDMCLAMIAHNTRVMHDLPIPKLFILSEIISQMSIDSSTNGYYESCMAKIIERAQELEYLEIKLRHDAPSLP